MTIDSVAGLARQRPWLAAALTICMLSLLGFPGTMGFVGKWAILAALVDAKQLPLAVILVVTSLISAGYYLPVIMAAYMRDPLGAEAHQGAGLPRTAVLTVGVALAVILVFGVLPSTVLGSALDVAATLGAGTAAAPLGIGR